MCWLLSHQKGAKLVTSLRDIQYALRAQALSVQSVHSAIVRLEDEQFITTERVSSGTLVTVLRPTLYAIMPLEEKDIFKPVGTTSFSVLWADVKTVLNYYRRVTGKRGDETKNSEAVIRYWLERGISKERLAVTVDAYENECESMGRTYRKFAYTFFDPENGLVEMYLPDEVEVEPQAELRESTRKMREVFARKDSKIS